MNSPLFSIMKNSIDETTYHSAVESMIHQAQQNQGEKHVFQFAHPVALLKIIETHISWIILTGQFAYKLKKPVRFDFVDYSDVSKRQTYCHREIDLNRRYAPEIYLDVCPIYKIDGRLIFGEVKDKTQNIQPVEYAVKMREFPQNCIAAAALSTSKNSNQLVENFGRFLADFHATADRADPSWSVVKPENVIHACRQNFDALQGYAFGNVATGQIDALHCWTEQQRTESELLMKQRLNYGFVRRCHGDLHLANIIIADNKLIPFDGIEFNPQFHWIDVFSEVAFVVMDLFAHGLENLGWRFLNAYFDATGHIQNIELLKFYLVYRALVRAKITVMQMESGCDQSLQTLHQYLDTANRCAFQVSSKLTITFGFSGSGKSTEALKLIDSDGGIRIRSDVVRKAMPADIRYNEQSINGVYSKLLDMAKSILTAGYSVVVDATFLQKRHRDDFQDLANDMQVEFRILKCQAEFEELAGRIQTRQNDPSEATLKVLKKQIAEHEPLNESEQRFVIAQV